MPSSLFALLDDIASVLDDVAVLTKVATKKTAGVLGDDLALNAEQVTGVAPDRELAVVWAVAKGSARNKVILVPAALLLSGVVPVVVTPLLMVGGAYLCFEGAEKVAHRFFHRDKEKKAHEEHVAAVADQTVDLVAFEKEKIKGATRTDFILSAEIVVIALGEVAAAPFGTRVAVLVALSTLMTVGVYGLVAGIVKLDDAGVRLAKREGSPALQLLGRGVLAGAPFLMKFLSVAGTAAMFLVGGSIVAHGTPGVHDWVERHVAQGGAIGAVLPTGVDVAFGVVTGLILLAIFSLAKRMIGRKREA